MQQALRPSALVPLGFVVENAAYVVGYGTGVGRASADVDHGDALMAGLDEMKSRHLRRAVPVAQ